MGFGVPEGPGARVRARFRYRGTVQGVGFRPTVYRCAASLDLTGFVRNERSEVVVELEGAADSVRAFPAALAAVLPLPARIEDLTVTEIKPHGQLESEFRIEQSRRTKLTLPPIPPDLATCPDCRRELLDPRDRRYLYPFITCTRCGPRYSIVEDTPFDRENTSMSSFPQCPECAREYGDPGDRRFHAQTNACARCGPRLTLRDARGNEVPGDPLLLAIQALGAGATVALLGLGGFHLAASPSRPEALERLRSDKRRERKPFALMVRDLEVARRFCWIEPEDEELLASPASPILILPARADAPPHLGGVSDTRTLGVMLPSTPLHHLLFLHPEADVSYDHLVMTSGNLRDEPIITDPAEGVRELGGLAELFLVHDRRVVFRTDDSVLRAWGGGGGKVHAPRRSYLFLRRSRGWVPRMIHLRSPVPEPILAAGGDLKSAVALALGSELYLGPYVGDLESLAALEAFEAQAERLMELFRVRPDLVVHDAHPGYRSSRWARERPWGRKIPVQHHHAHVLSVMAEHGLEEALGLAFDGTGFGEDGTVWGGEFLHATRSGFRRLGSFAPFALPGADSAVVNPARVAFAMLRERFPQSAARIPLEREERALLEDMIDRSVNSPPTSSVGRIFDAMASVIGIVRRSTYEGEGPIRMEGLAWTARRSGATPEAPPEELVSLDSREGRFVLDAAPLVDRLCELHALGAKSAGELALLAHLGIAHAALRGGRELRTVTGLSALALAGGVFQNALLLELLVPRLEEEGFAVFLNREAPPGDGGLALGQAWYRAR